MLVSHFHNTVDKISTVRYAADLVVKLVRMKIGILNNFEEVNNSRCSKCSFKFLEKKARDRLNRA